MNKLPLYTEIPYDDPARYFREFFDKPWAILLDSADAGMQREDTNRYSYIVVEPFETVVIRDHHRLETGEKTEDPFQYLQQILNRYQLVHHPELSLFQGGAVGYFSYDLCHYYEDIPKPSIAEPHAYADLAVGFYHTIIAFDHVREKAWVIATGFPETEQSRQVLKAEADREHWLQRLGPRKLGGRHARSGSGAIKLTRDLVSPFDYKSYQDMVKRAQQYILEGDIFEVNLSHRFEGGVDFARMDRYDLYLRMRSANPSPFSAYLNFDNFQILSTSPERFLSLKNGMVSTRPIKGTAPRSALLEEDEALAHALLVSEKDRAENVMIVDLLRNDLSKVCMAHGVHVKKLCGLETYPTVHHLVSVIEGQLRFDMKACDLLCACFPGGSITGVPKVRAMQIIYELEPTARGPYCGSVGFIGYNGAMDTSILIRTLLCEGKKVSYQVGGAVLLNSSPEQEYEETWTKSLSIRRVLNGNK